MIGLGIVKGLAVTARNFIGSYFDPARLTARQGRQWTDFEHDRDLPV